MPRALTMKRTMVRRSNSAYVCAAKKPFIWDDREMKDYVEKLNAIRIVEGSEIVRDVQAAQILSDASAIICIRTKLIHLEYTARISEC